MAFVKAQKQVAFGKVSFQGKEKSGKTTTAAMLAIYVAKKYHAGKPVAVLSSEPGLDFVLEMFDKEKIEVLADRRAAFVALKESIPSALKVGAGVLLIDSATTYWKELVKSYCEEKNIKGRLYPYQYTPIKNIWSQFTEQFVPAKLDIIVCGRLGYEFEELTDDEGRTDSHRSGTKMKTEGEFNYETDLIVEMEKRDDLGGNAEKADPKSKSLKRKFEHNAVHVATVKGSRVWALNNQAFQFRAERDYKPGMAMKVGQSFAPYFDFLKNGQGDGDVLQGSNSRSEFAGAIEQKNTRATVALEEIKGALGCVFTADIGKDKAAKTEIINEVFGTHSWTAVEKLGLEALEWGSRVCRKLKQLCIDTPPADRDGLLNLVSQAKADAKFEEGLPQNVVKQLEVQLEDMPF